MSNLSPYLTRPPLLVWLLACWQANRYASGLVFSKRNEFLRALRPQVPGYVGVVVDYPDAWFLIRPSDVRRAAKEPKP